MEPKRTTAKLRPRTKPPRKTPSRIFAFNDKRDDKFLVRGVEILSFMLIDNIVHFKIEVTATERRYWTIIRRYSDFSILEHNTWQLRGPMPPFPHAWEGVQILLHLVEPVIQRKSRLETKKQMLQDWLERLVQRARHSKKLQSHVNNFVNVYSEFESANSRLLLSANNVTQLVVTNPESNVEAILLKLSTNVDLLSTTKGKQTLNRARKGPMSDVPISLLDLDALPITVMFDLAQQTPTLKLEILNKSSRAKAFKVMATEPTRYFVSPAQCLIYSNQSRIVSIFMPDGFDSAQSYVDDQDRFLFVSYELEQTDAQTTQPSFESRVTASPNLALDFDLPTTTAVSTNHKRHQTTPIAWQSFANEQLVKKKISVRFLNRPILRLNGTSSIRGTVSELNNSTSGKHYKPTRPRVVSEESAWSLLHWM